ncbi:hypothetical protein AB0L64_32085 [Kribbella sp. NPDC051936]|uniref:hypothetical protein n=1 Tax=Kribbella sp. NPDC051936 TaxID=3154946 RepID=UPI0034191F82
MIRKVAGVLLAVVGLIVAVVGGVAAFWLIGPDDTVHSGEQSLSSKGLAIASTPELLNRNGPVLHVDVRSAKDQPVFVGVARDFDVASYLNGTAHTKLVQVQFPIALSTEDSKGTAGPLTAPATLDWWITKASGPGRQSIAWPIEDGPYDVVIMNADGKTAPDVQLNLGIEIPKAFLTALAVFALGILLLALGILLILFRRRPTKPDALDASTAVSRVRDLQNTMPLQRSGQSRPRQPAPAAPRAIRRGGGLVLVVGLVTGCSAVPPVDTVKELTRPAISDTAAAAVIRHYNDVSSKANSTMNDELLAAVEGGDRLRQSQAWGEIARAVKAKPAGVHSYTNPVIGSPLFGGYPMRFVSSAGLSGEKDYRHLGVWERATAGSTWKLTFAAALRTTTKLPDLVGLRVATAADDTKLASATQAVAPSLATYLTDGPKSPRATAFQANADIAALFADIADDKAEQAKDPGSVLSLTNTFTAPAESPAFVTKSGTAVVFVSLTHKYRLQVGYRWQFWWDSFPESVYSPPTVKYETALTSTTIHEAVLLVPPKGKGKIQVLTFASQLVEAGGY